MRGELLSALSKGAEPPLFCIHPAGGHVNEYGTLSTLVGQTVYGISSGARLDAALEHSTLRAMAAEYARLVTVTAPGPYALLGYSMGAITAHAVACELERRGSVVSFVGMADPTFGSTGSADEFLVGVTMAIRIFNPTPPSTLRRELRALEKEPVPLEAIVPWCRERQLIPREGVADEAVVAAISLFQIHRGLVLQHTPETCLAPLVLWLPDPTFRRSPYDWSRHTRGGIRERVVGGTHFTIMRSPHVERIADEIVELSHR